MPNNVYVVTGLELGWDCVVGVFATSSVNYDDLRNQFPKGQYVITTREVEFDTSNYADWDC